ncbi:MAG: hypothetical protein EOO72_03645 [Myxococcaceae bacterium]|nr:MAG: hypothetical protein EOO72_03645 [Myxococcaceae bacterium]
MFAVACDADRALEDIPEDFLIQAEAALDGGGVVELESNVLKGTVRLTNTNPQVLALLATDPWRNGSAAVTATSTTPAGFTSRTNSFVLVNPSEYRFEMLVEAGAGGEQGVVYNLSAARGGYVFPSLSGVTVRPVATQPAPADVTVESCIGVVQFEFGTDATCQTPAAVFAPTVDGLSLYKSSTGHYTGYITGGTARAASLVITFNTPTGQLQTVQPVQLAAGCDEIVRTCLSGLPPPPPPLGSATGAFEIHGEEVSSKQLPIIGTGGRLHLLPGPWSPVSHPERWWFVPDLHVGNYLVDARVYLRSGRSFTLFDAPGWGELSIEEGQTTVLTKQVGGATRHAFDMHPAYFHGSIRLVDPFVPLHPGAWSSLQALYFEADHDADGDGAPDDIEIGSRGTYLSAGGLNGYSRTAFPGAFDAARGELVSTYEQVLAAPYDLPQAWSQDRLYLRFWSEPTGSGPFTTRPGLYDPERYRYGALWLRATSGFATTLQPEQRFRVDHEYCFSEVQVQYATSQGRIFNPWAEVSGSFSGRDWRDQQVSYVAAGNFLGTPAAVNTPNPNAYAQPSGQVSLTLPQGSFTLKPGASLVTETGAVNTANFAPLGVTVGCGQRLKLVPPLAVSVSSSQGCATSSSTPVTGRVKSLPAEVDRIWYRLNGGPEVTLCTNCGIDPTFSTNVTLQACDNALTVYAFSEGMSEPATATEQLVWDDPEDGPSCAGSFCVNRPPVARCKGVVVSADSACSGCGSVDDGSYDPDTGDSVHCVQTPACPHPLGSHTATLTCTDSSGLTSSCEAKVTVRDTQPPTLTCPAPLVVERTGPDR